MPIPQLSTRESPWLKTMFSGVTMFSERRSGIWQVTALWQATPVSHGTFLTSSCMHIPSRHALLSILSPTPQLTLQLPMVHSPYTAARMHSLWSTRIPWPHDALQVPTTHSLMTTCTWQDLPLSHGWVLVRGSVHVPETHPLLSVLVPLPHEALQVPMIQSL